MVHAMRKSALVLVTTLLVAACGGPKQEGQGVKSPEELLELQLAQNEQRAASSNSDGSDEYLSEETDEEKRQKFDDVQTERELIRASRSAKTCVGVVTVDGPRGVAKVTLTFANDGNVKSFDINSPFKDTPLGNCILNAMKAVIVPPYVGPEHTMSWDINLDEES